MVHDRVGLAQLRDRLRELGQHLAQLAHDRHVGRAVLGDLRRVDVHVDDLRAGRERVELAGHAVVEARAHRDQQVGAVERPVGELGAVHARHLQRERVRVGERALRHQRRDDRDLRLLGERLQLGLGAGVDDAAADVEHRLLGARDRERRLLDLQRVALARGPVAGQVDLLGPAERERRVGDVLRDVDQHRPRAPGRGEVEGLHEHARDVLDLRDEVGVLDDRQEDAGRVGLLEGVRADQVRRDLARDDHHRRRVEERVGDRRDEVRRAGPGRRHGDADLAGRARVALRHVAGALLVAHEHVLDRGPRRGERVVDRKDRPAGDPEADLDAARLERADNGLRAGEALAFVGIGRGRLGGGGPLLCGGHTSLPVGQLAMGEETVSASAISSATSSVVAVPPRSGVRAPSSSTPVTAPSIARAAAGCPSSSSSSAIERIAPAGLAVPLPGDVGRRAVDRLEDARPSVGQRGRGREPDAAADGGGEVGEHVAEEVLGHDHVVGGGPLDEQHRHRVDELVLERHVRDAARRPRRPRAARAWRSASTLALSTLVTRPLRRSARMQARSTMRRISSRGVVAGVVGRVVAEPAVAEVDAADQLAHDHEVELGDELLAQRARRVPRVAARRADVGVAAEHRAQREQSLLGPDRRRRSSAGRRPRPAAPRRRPGRPRAWHPGTGGRRSSIAAPPNGRSSSSTANPKRDEAAVEHAQRRRVTSGPMPSPGRTQILMRVPPARCG